MEKEKALKMWDDIFGNRKWATDCFGIWMYRDDYGDTSTKRNDRPGGTGESYSYGWEVDHIRPRSNFENESDADFMNNYEPMHWDNNRSKADNYPNFSINEKQYKVVKCDICSRYGIKGYGITNNLGKRIDWKGTTNRYYKKN
ncbi:hypothetical protein J6Y73_03205 [bacterium]|nr:hypothetical protein [bacterium]